MNSAKRRFLNLFSISMNLSASLGTDAVSLALALLISVADTADTFPMSSAS